MKRYAAFLRGVSPMNAKMPDLKRSFEAAGFTDVKTVLSSGNVAFNAREASVASLEKRAEGAMTAELGRAFFTIIRPVDALTELLESDPFARFTIPPGAKRVVTFFRVAPQRKLKLPVEDQGARILLVQGNCALTVYEPHPGNPVFMTLIEKAFGREATTRTWDTVKKVVRA